MELESTMRQVKRTTYLLSRQYVVLLYAQNAREWIITDKDIIFISVSQGTVKIILLKYYDSMA